MVGTVVNPAGLTHAKTVPPRRLSAFADPGLGASPVWHVFAIDQTGIAFTKDMGVVGDERIRLDLTALRTLGDGLAWAPGAFFDQGRRTDTGVQSRHPASRRGPDAATPGFEALFGHEIEFLLVGPDGSRLPSALWAQYGLAGVLEHEAFVRDVTTAAAAAGVGIEQFHPEYGQNQFEISLSPLAPVAAADQLVLMRLVIGRVARRYGAAGQLFTGAVRGQRGIRCAPTLFADRRTGTPVFSGGSGEQGNDGGRRARDRRDPGRAARGAGRAQRIDRLRIADPAGLLGRSQASAGAPRTGRRRSGS